MSFIILVFVAVVLVIIFGRTPVTIKGHWKHFYDNTYFPTMDFYEQVQKGLKDRKIDRISFSKEAFLESHFFSTKRVYLRIDEHEYVFYICAAPFGTGTFVSWWLCIKDERLINKIPVISKLLGLDRSRKTFYQMDSEAMYQSMIHTVVVSVSDELTAANGYRLSELDRQYREISAAK